MLSRWYFLTMFVLIITSTTGVIFSWPPVYNTVGKFYDFSYEKLLKIYLPATSLNPIGASIAGFLVDAIGAKWSTVWCLSIGLIGCIVWTNAFYKNSASVGFNAGYCLIALGLGGTNVTVANVASLFSNPSMIYTLNSALYAASVFPFLFVDLCNQGGFDAKYGYLIYTIWVALLLVVVIFTFPHSFVKEMEKPAKGQRKENLKKFLKILKQPRFYFFIICTDIFCTVCFVQYSSNINDVMVEVGAPKYTSTVWTVISGCGGLVLTPIVGLISRRIGIVWILIISFLLYGAFAGCLWIHEPWAPLLNCCIYVTQKAFFYAGQYTFISWMWGWDMYGYCIGFMDIITFVFVELLQLYSGSKVYPTQLELTAVLLTIAACLGFLYSIYLFFARHRFNRQAVLENQKISEDFEIETV